MYRYAFSIADGAEDVPGHQPNPKIPKLTLLQNGFPLSRE